jgi:hypothetical protein
LVIAPAAQLRLPAIYEWWEFAEAGGLMSYGTSLTETYRQASDFVVRILKGANPADLPVQQSTKYELVINLKTANDWPPLSGPGGHVSLELVSWPERPTERTAVAWLATRRMRARIPPVPAVCIGVRCGA